LQVDPQRIHELTPARPLVVCGCRVTAIPANHCPGAVLLAFEAPGRPPVLHCGDCRYERAAFQGDATLRALRGRAVVHLDTTYCAPQHSFPLQREVVDAVVAMCVREDAAARAAGGAPPLFAFGSYTIGKERLFMEVRCAARNSNACIAITLPAHIQQWQRR
jgi:DNA cross-link repair 1A protein